MQPTSIVRLFHNHFYLFVTGVQSQNVSLPAAYIQFTLPTNSKGTKNRVQHIDRYRLLYEISIDIASFMKY
jgi:hypothetical protein